MHEASRGPTRFAVKICLDPAAGERFLREAERLRRIDHPHVIRVLETGHLDDGRPYFAMDLIEGGTLAQLVSRRGALPPREAITIVEALADALEAIHEAGLIHRDVKAENVVLRGDAPVLLDLGIAQDHATEGTTTTGIVRGTLATMAPERFFGRKATVASDVYELGVLAYFLLVGNLPWGDAADADARLAIVAPSVEGVPRAISAVVMSALSTRIERRPKSPSIFARRLRDALGESVDEERGRTTAAISQRPRPASTKRRTNVRVWFALALAAGAGAIVIRARALAPSVPGVEAKISETSSETIDASPSADTVDAAVLAVTADASADASAPSPRPKAPAATAFPKKAVPPPGTDVLADCEKLAALACEHDYLTGSDPPNDHDCQFRKKKLRERDEMPRASWPHWNELCRKGLPEYQQRIDELRAEKPSRREAIAARAAAEAAAKAREAAENADPGPYPTQGACKRLWALECDPRCASRWHFESECTDAKRAIATFDQRPAYLRKQADDLCAKDYDRDRAAIFRKCPDADAGP